MGTRVPELGYYLIVTDTKETEKNYFEGMRDSIPTEIKDHLVIKIEKAKTVELVKKALELRGQDSQYRIPWIVFDRDQVEDFDRIKRYYRRCVEGRKKEPAEMWSVCRVQELVGEIREDRKRDER